MYLASNYFCCNFGYCLGFSPIKEDINIPEAVNFQHVMRLEISGMIPESSL